MPNRSSNAGHIPQRTCVVCRTKTDKKKLIRFVLLNSEIVFDLNCKIEKRGYYVCDDNNCLQKLEKRVKKILRSRSLNGR
jgi:predicted RNA-binding protein YlxR (DUF448 family)